MEGMTAFPLELIAEIEPGDESDLPGRVAVDGDTAARLEALARLVELPTAEVVPTASPTRSRIGAGSRRRCG